MTVDPPAIIVTSSTMTSKTDQTVELELYDVDAVQKQPVDDTFVELNDNKHDLKEYDRWTEDGTASIRESGKKKHYRLVDFTDDDKSFGAQWHRLIVANLHRPVNRVLVAIARVAASYPKITITSVVVLSLLVTILGVATNFNVDVNQDTLWSPLGSNALNHFDWIQDYESTGFPAAPRIFYLNIHSNGENVLGKEGMARVFTALDTIRETPGFDELCLNSEEGECKLISPTKLWNHNAAMFEEQVSSDEVAIDTLSMKTYPVDNSPVVHTAIMGNPEFDGDARLENAQMFLVQIHLPGSDEEGSLDFEEVALENIDELQDAWQEEKGNKFRVEYYSERSPEDEVERAIVQDIPLVPGVFIMMSIFTSLVFFTCDKVQSRATLGFGAVCCVLLAIMTGYGICFVFGVPFTSMTQILPFIMFGIGLDAAFILSGSFERTDPSVDIVDRICETVEDVGMSITLTTLTSALAFALGCISSVPAVIWLCLYAFPTILVDYLFQFTFYLAVLAIDEKRVLDKRRDCLCCLKVKQDEREEVMEEQEAEDKQGGATEDGPERSRSDRFMMWYADKLLDSFVTKIGVIVAFVLLLVGCSYSTTQLEQSFNFRDMTPNDSYIAPFFDTLIDYTSLGRVFVDVYFRNEDQSNVTVQQQMEDFVNELVDMKEIDSQPSLFWLRDFNGYVEDNADLQGLPFYEQFDAFYNDPVYNQLYADHIALDENGEISSSRTTLFMNNINDEEVKELVDALEAQLVVTDNQPANEGKSEYSFFTYAFPYLLWEFYNVAVEELILTTILGVVAVSVLSLFCMPHYTAILFVTPLICVLYVDLLGVLQFAGASVNPVSYVAMVMSIGLMVDFIVHILLRYYEVKGNRVERSKEMLRTMGSSVMLGGFSTFLGVLPLAFSSSEIFTTIFISFMGLVTLGISHGLILLPVLLSFFGPESKVVEEIETTEHFSDKRSL